MNFLLNMNIRREMIAPLQERGHVYHHVWDISVSRAKDVEIVVEAKKTGDILTYDLDYGHWLVIPRLSQRHRVGRQNQPMKHIGVLR